MFNQKLDNFKIHFDLNAIKVHCDTAEIHEQSFRISEMINVCTELEQDLRNHDANIFVFVDVGCLCHS